MTDPTATIQGLRDRLTGLLADWGAELALVLKELEEKRGRVAELESAEAERASEIEALRQRLDGQNTLIETLRSDAEEVAKLRAELRNKDVDLERVSSELESKKELVRALRRDGDGGERLKAEARQKERHLEELKSKLQRAETKASEAAEQLAILREKEARKGSDEESELEVLRAELEARKTLVKSLRADQGRVSALQASLEEKRDIIEQLEAAINRHSNTIAELRRSADTWKRKYQALKGDSPTATTSVNLPSLSDTDVRVVERLEKATDGKPDATIAIDMRRPLLEARRTASKANSER